MTRQPKLRVDSLIVTSGGPPHDTHGRVPRRVPTIRACEEMPPLGCRRHDLASLLRTEYLDIGRFLAPRAQDRRPPAVPGAKLVSRTAAARGSTNASKMSLDALGSSDSSCSCKAISEIAVREARELRHVVEADIYKSLRARFLREREEFLRRLLGEPEKPHSSCTGPRPTKLRRSSLSRNAIFCSCKT